MLLADIGNSRMHIYNGTHIEHLDYQEAIKKYKDERLCYISVQHNLALSSMPKWQDVSEFVTLNGAYDGMGIDRQALCLATKDGILVDAGSAITVDVVKSGKWVGGSILLGLRASQKAYGGISSALDVHLNKKVDISTLPQSTSDAISYGIIAPIKTLLNTLTEEHATPLYFTGGDGALLASLFDGALYDESLVFKGLQHALKDASLC